MFPFEGMPIAAQWLAEILPLTHFLRLIRGIMLRGAGLGEMWPDVLALAAFIAGDDGAGDRAVPQAAGLKPSVSQERPCRSCGRLGCFDHPPAQRIGHRLGDDDVDELADQARMAGEVHEAHVLGACR